MSDQGINLKFIVNGQPIDVTAFLGWELREAAKKALEKSGNVGQPIDNWELRDGAGTVLDMGLKIARSDIQEGSTFFLNLKAGIGGFCGG